MIDIFTNWIAPIGATIILILVIIMLIQTIYWNF